MNESLRLWLTSEKRCTERFRLHVEEIDRLVTREVDLAPLVHCLVRFPEAELPSDSFSPSEAREWRQRLANGAQSGALEYLKEQGLDFDPLWLINATSVRLPWEEELVVHLVNLAVHLPRNDSAACFDYVPPAHLVGIEEVEDGVFGRIETEMSSWKASGKAMGPLAMVPALQEARLLTGLDGSGVRVAMLDSGVDASHPDLAGRVDAPTDFEPVNGSRAVLAEVRPGECFTQIFNAKDQAIKRIDVQLVFGLRRKGGAFLQRPLKPRIAAQIRSPKGTITALNLNPNRSQPVPVGQVQAERYFYETPINPVEHGPYHIEVTCAEAEAMDIFTWKRALIQIEAKAFDGPAANARSWLLPFVGVEDDWGHGTRVAGVVVGSGAASGSIYRGLAPGARMLSVKVIQSPGVARPTDRLKEALNWLGSQDEIRLINISLGSVTDCDQRQQSCPVCDEVNRLVKELKKIVVVSAGNLGSAGTTCPAKATEAIVVGCAGWSDPQWASEKSSYDKNSNLPHLLAVGEDVATPLARFALSKMTLSPTGQIRVEQPAGLAANGAYVTGSGTSLAAAAVTGLLARLLQRRPALKADQARKLLCDTATALNVPPGKDREAQGAGLINARTLCDALPALRLSEVYVSPTQAQPGSQVIVEAKVENTTDETIEAIRVVWTLRGADSVLCGGAENPQEFHLPAQSQPQHVKATITLPVHLKKGAKLDLVCTCQGEIVFTPVILPYLVDRPQVLHRHVFQEDLFDLHPRWALPGNALKAVTPRTEARAGP